MASFSGLPTALHGQGRLAPKFYGPFKVLERVGKVAYGLKLQPDSRIHDVFLSHYSMSLKRRCL